MQNILLTFLMFQFHLSSSSPSGIPLLIILICESRYFMFEYIYVFEGVVTHIIPQVAPVWVKVIAAETICMVQTELFNCMDKSIRDYKSWVKLILEKGVAFDKHIKTITVQDWVWKSAPDYLQLVSLKFFET